MIPALWIGCSQAIPDGVAAFEAGSLTTAIETWEKASDQRSGVLAYDLGVAYYRKDDLPRAIAELRAAARLRPRDENVQHNLALARSGLTDVPPPVVPPVWSLLVTAGEIGLTGVLLAAVGSAMLWAERSRLAGVACLLAGLGLGGFGARAAAEQQLHPVGVIVDGEVVLRDAADVNAGERLRLPPGTEVQVQRHLGEFVLVVDGRGRRGWAPTNGVREAW